MSARIWSAAIALSAALHAVAFALIGLSIRATPPPDQPMPETRVLIEAAEVTRSRATPETPATANAPEAVAQAAPGRQGIVPLATAAPLPLTGAPAAVLATAAPALPAAETRPTPTQAAQTAAPAQPARIPTAAKAAQAAASAQALAPWAPASAPVRDVEVLATSVQPAAVATAAALTAVAASGVVARASAAKTQTMLASLPTPVKAATARPAVEVLTARATPVQATLAVVATAQGIAAMAAPAPAAAPADLTAPPVPSRDAPSEPAQGIAAPATTAATAEPRAAVATALAALAPSAPGLTTIGAAAPAARADTQTADTLPLPSQPGKAELAWSGGGDAAIPAASLAAIAAFTQQGDLAAASAQVRDGIAGVLASVPCARLQTVFHPETGGLELRGHIPEDGLRAPVVAALRDLVGDAISLSDNLLILPRPQCGALSGIADVGLPQSTEQLHNPKVIGAGGFARNTTFYAGDAFYLDMWGADYDSYLYVDYFTADGNVIHLQPNSFVPLEKVAAKAKVVVAKSTPDKPALTLTIGPPYGQEIAAAFAASVPLYDDLRPVQEPAAPYLAFLKAQVARARSEHRDFKGEWVYFFISTRAR